MSDVPPRRDTEVVDLKTRMPRSKRRHERRPTSAGSTLADDLESRTVDLIDLIERGVPPTEYLPGSEGMLVAGARHSVAAPRKSGKSFAFLAHAVDMARRGAVVVILDRENGKRIAAQRVKWVLESREAGRDAHETVRRNLTYVEFPRLTRRSGPELVEWVRSKGACLVLFDAQRRFLTDLGLKESDSDDFAAFMEALVDPLFEVGVATLILDNTGHRDQERARGSSAKGDLADAAFHMEEVSPYSKEQSGLVRLVLDFSREGDQGAWDMALGRSRIGSWERVGRTGTGGDALADAVLGVLADAGGVLALRTLRERARARGATFANKSFPSKLAALVRAGKVMHVDGRYGLP